MLPDGIHLADYVPTSFELFVRRRSGLGEHARAFGGKVRELLTASIVAGPACRRDRGMIAGTYARLTWSYAKSLKKMPTSSAKEICFLVCGIATKTLYLAR